MTEKTSEEIVREKVTAAAQLGSLNELEVEKLFAAIYQLYMPSDTLENFEFAIFPKSVMRAYENNITRSTSTQINRTKVLNALFEAATYKFVPELAKFLKYTILKGNFEVRVPNSENGKFWKMVYTTDSYEKFDVARHIIEQIHDPVTTYSYKFYLDRKAVEPDRITAPPSEPEANPETKSESETKQDLYAPVEITYFGEPEGSIDIKGSGFSQSWTSQRSKPLDPFVYNVAFIDGTTANLEKCFKFGKWDFVIQEGGNFFDLSTQNGFQCTKLDKNYQDNIWMLIERGRRTKFTLVRPDFGPHNRHPSLHMHFRMIDSEWPVTKSMKQTNIFDWRGCSEPKWHDIIRDISYIDVFLCDKHILEISTKILHSYYPKIRILTEYP